MELDDSDVFLDVDKSGAADDDVVRADHKLLPNLPTVFVLKILYTCKNYFQNVQINQEFTVGGGLMRSRVALLRAPCCY